MKVAELLGKIFGVYFMGYPLIYFAWNFFIAGIGFPQYIIPGFWIGFAGFFIFDVFTATLERIIRG